MADSFDGPLPLITATFTTEELAAMCAGLIRLRRDLSTKRLEWSMFDTAQAQEAIANIDGALQDCTNTYNRIEAMVTPAQAQELLKGLFRKPE